MQHLQLYASPGNLSLQCSPTRCFSPQQSSGSASPLKVSNTPSPTLLDRISEEPVGDLCYPCDVLNEPAAPTGSLRCPCDVSLTSDGRHYHCNINNPEISITSDTGAESFINISSTSSPQTATDISCDLNGIS